MSNQNASWTCQGCNTKWWATDPMCWVCEAIRSNAAKKQAATCNTVQQGTSIPVRPAHVPIFCTGVRCAGPGSAGRVDWDASLSQWKCVYCLKLYPSPSNSTPGQHTAIQSAAGHPMLPSNQGGACLHCGRADGSHDYNCPELDCNKYTGQPAVQVCDHDFIESALTRKTWCRKCGEYKSEETSG